MIRMYTNNRKCFRWPYGYFFNLVDVGLQQLNASTSQAKTNAFLFEFLMNVGYQLLHAHISKRFIATSSKTILLAMFLLGYTSSICAPGIQVGHQREWQTGRCVQCGRQKDKKQQ